MIDFCEYIYLVKLADGRYYSHYQDGELITSETILFANQFEHETDARIEACNFQNSKVVRVACYEE